VTRDGRRFDPAEVSGPGTDAIDADVAAAMAAARLLQATIPATDGPASPDLADRIMRAIAREPAPRAVGIVAALRRRPGLGGVADSLRVAWHRALGGGSPALRGAAMAYVAAILVLSLSISGVAAYTAAGALGILPRSTHGPEASQPISTPGPLPSPEASDRESAEPSESAEPGEADDPGATTGASHEPGDDHGGSGGGGGQTASPSHEDGSGGGGDGSSSAHTPSPSATPNDTPKASATPHPSSGSGSDG
jgi:hypothetical protein